MTIPPISATSGPLASPLPIADGEKQRDAMMAKARELEAAFLSEMLKYTGLDQGSKGLFGSAGEDQFGSFLRDAQARQMEEKGGLGLAESLFRALTRHQDGQA